MTNYVFSDKEIKCKDNYHKVKKSERAILQQRFNDKVKRFNSKKLIRDLSFVPLDKRKEVIEGILKGLPVGYAKALSVSLNKEASASVEDMKNLSKRLEKMSAKNKSKELTFEESFGDNKDWIIRKIINDYFYLKQSKQREELFRDILARGIEEVKKTKSERTKLILKEFYERGIILDESVSDAEFEAKCRKIIESANVVREGWLNYRIYPFKAKPNFLKSRLRMNIIYISDIFVKFSLENFKDFGIFHEGIH